jgi:hypothetical protein
LPLITDFLHPPPRSSLAAGVTCLLSLILASGCAPGTGSVSGTVTYKGERVPSGTVSFLSGGKVLEAEIRDGAYEISGLPLGESRIAVVRLDPDQPDPAEALHGARQRMAEGKVADPKQIDPGVVTDPLQQNALQKKRHLLPLAYSSPETSGLRLKVMPGANTFDIQLLDQPKAR